MKATAKQTKAAINPNIVEATIKDLAKKAKTKEPQTMNALPILDVTPAEQRAPVMVISSKTETKTLEINAAQVSTVLPMELNLAAEIKQSLCYNIMAGQVTPAITAAIESKKPGALQKLLPKVGKNDISALKTLLIEHTPDYIVVSWNRYCGSVKRVREVSLQAMVKACKGSDSSDNAPRISLKEALISWVQANPEDVKTLPSELVDILVDFNLVDAE